MIHYLTICSSIDGKKYREATSCTEEFYNSRHKKNCINSKNEMFIFEQKKDGVTIEICKGCGYSIGASYHFPEDEINLTQGWSKAVKYLEDLVK